MALNDNIRKRLNIHSTINELDLSSLSIEINRPTKEIYSKFEIDKTTAGIILTNNGIFSGMISRRYFFELMSKPYSLELFLKRSIENFYQDIEPGNSLLIPASTQISIATSRALQRNPNDIYEPVVVIMNNDTYCILDIDQLLLAQSVIHSQLVDQLNQNVSYVKNLLDNSGQGFLTIKNDLYVESQYSNECKNIFGYDIEHIFFPKLIYPDNERQQSFLEKIIIRILNEKDRKTLNKYFPLLPDETIIGSKFINISYKLIKNSDKSENNKLMIILTDISEKRNLESAIESERNILKMVVKVTTNLNLFDDLVKEFTHFYRYKLPDIIKNKDSFEEIITEVYREIHTFKGNFSQIDLVHSVKRLHKIESDISRFNENKNSHSESDLLSLFDQFNLHTILDQDINILKNILGNNFISDLKIIKIPLENIINIENRLYSIPHSNEIEEVILEIRKLRSRSVKEILSPITDYTIKLANNYQKTIKVYSIEGDDVYLNQNEYGDFFKSLIHIFRNAVDHGIEFPDERILKGKKEEGNIQCNIKVINDCLIVRISDDGEGINISKLKNKLLSTNIIDTKTLNNMTDEEVIQYIYKEQVSTKDSISELSGRGMGLSAVYSEVKKLDGSIKVISVPDTGTEFNISIPLKKTLVNYCLESTKVLDIIIKTTLTFLKNEINLQEVLADSITTFEKERLTLKTFSSFIGIKGIIDAKIIITIEYKLAKYLLNHFLHDEVPSENEIEYLEDTVAETLNNIIGNSTQELAECGKSIEFESPVIMTSDEAIFKYPPVKKWNCSIKTDHGDFLLYIIQN